MEEMHQQLSQEQQVLHLIRILVDLVLLDKSEAPEIREPEHRQGME